MLVTAFLGEHGASQSVVTRELPPFEHVNLQTALNAWTRGERDVIVEGFATSPDYGTVSLQQLISGEALPPLRRTAPPLVDLPNGPGTTLACLRSALLLVTENDRQYVVMVSAPAEHDPRLRVEVGGLPVDAAQAVHAELDALRSRLNVYRGHLLDVSLGPDGRRQP